MQNCLIKFLLGYQLFEKINQRYVFEIGSGSTYIFNNNNNNGYITAFPHRGSTSAKVYIKIYYTINRKSLRKFKTKD